jgi:hypothetical protein
VHDAPVNAIRPVPTRRDQLIVIVRLIKHDFNLYVAARGFVLSLGLDEFSDNPTIFTQGFTQLMTTLHAVVIDVFRRQVKPRSPKISGDAIYDHRNKHGKQA